MAQNCGVSVQAMKGARKPVWQHHFIIVGMLVAMALPVYALDYVLLKPSGDIFLLNLRNILIAAYAAWLAVHILLSSLALYLLKTDRLYRLHGIAAISSAALLIASLSFMDRMEAARWRAEHEARMTLRKGLSDTITLERWWYEPGTGKPKAVGAVLTVRHAGRLAASVEGRTGGRTVYHGDMKPQKHVSAGDRVEYIFPLEYYSGENAADVSFTFMLFRDTKGSAPEDIFKEYADIPEKTDDGRYFRDVLPPPRSSHEPAVD